MTWSGAFVLDADTSPDAQGPLAAPHHCLNAKYYIASLRRRWERDPGARQQLFLLSRHVTVKGRHEPIACIGPYASEAEAVLRAISRAVMGRVQ